jgi:GNAT superfamily N-acetyltransferase
VLRVLAQEDLAERANSLGRTLQNRLEAHQTAPSGTDRHPLVQSGQAGRRPRRLRLQDREPAMARQFAVRGAEKRLIVFRGGATGATVSWYLHCCSPLVSLAFCSTLSTRSSMPFDAKDTSQRSKKRRVQPPTKDIDTCSQEDYLQIMKDLGAYWSTDHPERLARIRILHHPMFVYEPTSTAFVFRGEGRVSAYLFGFFSQAEEPVAYVHMVATHESCRRRGLAAKMYQHFIETAVLHGCQSIKAITSVHNDARSPFIARSGWSRRAMRAAKTACHFDLPPKN